MSDTSYVMMSDPLLESNESEVDLAPTIRNDDMVYITEIGRGGMSRIFLYRLTQNGHSSEVVVKTLFRRYLTERDLTYLRTETSILTNVQHDNIIRTYGITQTSSGFGLVMEHMSNGSYIDFFWDIWSHELKTQQLDEIVAPLKIRILTQIVDAMEYLHRPHRFPSSSKSKSILHLDLKGENVLLDQHLHAKICDFGLSRMSTLTNLRTSTTMNNGRAAGTPGFIAPEWLRDPHCRPSKKCDVYSFGILKYTVLTDLPPYEDFDFRNLGLLEHHVVRNNCRPDISNISSAYPRYLTELMMSCWDPVPAKRPSFAELKIAMQTAKENIDNFNEQADHAFVAVMTIRRNIKQSTISSGESERTSRSTTTEALNTLDTFTKHPLPPSSPVNTNSPTSSRSDQGQPGDAGVNREIEGTLFRGNPIAPYELPFCSITKIWLGVAVVGISVVLIALGVIIPRINQPVEECPPVLKPRHGKANCVNETTDVAAKCQFTCNDGYAIIGRDTILCNGGRWTSKEPSCKIACKFPEISNGEMKCTNKTFQNSSCSIICNNHRVIQGKSVITCLENGSWSAPISSCVCPMCSEGDTCEYLTSWQNVHTSLAAMQPYGAISVNYGKKSFVCSTHLHSLPPLDSNLRACWTGVCVDTETGTKASCANLHISTYEAAQSAAAKLIRNLTKSGIYSEPCDADKMPRPTDC